jgi:hypothetical protein
MMSPYDLGTAICCQMVRGAKLKTIVSAAMAAHYTRFVLVLQE